MLVKVKRPERVYFDREQQLIFTGEEAIPTKATYMVRQLLNMGDLIEVLEPTAAELAAAELAAAELAAAELSKVDKATTE